MSRYPPQHWAGAYNPGPGGNEDRQTQTEERASDLQAEKEQTAYGAAVQGYSPVSNQSQPEWQEYAVPLVPIPSIFHRSPSVPPAVPSSSRVQYDSYGPSPPLLHPPLPDVPHSLARRGPSPQPPRSPSSYSPIDYQSRPFALTPTEHETSPTELAPDGHASVEDTMDFMYKSMARAEKLYGSWSQAGASRARTVGATTAVNQPSSSSDTNKSPDQKPSIMDMFVSQLAYLMSNPDAYKDSILWDHSGTVVLLSHSPLHLLTIGVSEASPQSDLSSFLRQLALSVFQQLDHQQLCDHLRLDPSLSTAHFSGWRRPQFTKVGTTPPQSTTPQTSPANPMSRLPD